MNALRWSKEQASCLDVLPYIRLRVYHTHVGLFRTTVHEYPIILVQERVPCVILKGTVRGKRHKIRETNPRVTAGLWPRFLRKGW